MLVGERQDIDITNKIDFSNNGWEANIREYAGSHWNQKYCGGMDYFIFPKKCLEIIPPFAVGRGGWDNWIIYHARKNKIPVIDGTRQILVIHQNHDYNHIKNKTGPQWEGPETEQNYRLAGNIRHFWQITDANWLLEEKGLRKKPTSLVQVNQYLILILPERFYPILDLVISLRSKMKKKKSEK